MDKIHRVIIVDGHQILREGLRALLGKKSGLDVIGEADNGKDALQCVVTTKPDVVLLDLSMPRTSGLKLIRDIKRRSKNTKVIVLTAHQEEEYVHAALRAGADAYVLKRDSHADLLTALRSVAAGKIYLSPSICGSVVKRYLGHSETPDVLPSWHALTDREREVVTLIAEGYRNRGTAKYLGISHKTVEKHRSNLMKKLDLHSTSELTTYAIQNGLVSTAS